MVRTARVYRTVSRAAAAVLASIPPLDLTAAEHLRVFEGLRKFEREHNVRPTLAVKNRMRRYSHAHTVREWRTRLRQQWVKEGGRVLEAFEPILEDWLASRRAPSFHAAQVLSGHGCFSVYLRRIGREETEVCFHCGVSRDDAQHTLERCSAWEQEREVLVGKVGQDLSLPALVQVLVDNEEAWKTFLTFCSQVMQQKEDAERQRRGQPTVTRPTVSPIVNSSRMASASSNAATSRVPVVLQGNQPTTGARRARRVGAETGLTTATEDETRLTSRQVSANSADPQEEDADTDIICVNSSDASDASVRTTASGAFKRTRKRKDDDTIKKTRRTADRSSSSSERSFFGNDGKKRGRPLVTGKGAQILNIRAKNQELQSLKDEIKTMREIAEGGYDPSDFKGKRRTVMAERLEQEAIGLPVNAMAAEILQTAKKIEEVAVKSNNLKGGFVRILREAALKIEVNTDAMFKKIAPQESATSQEVEQLKEEVNRLREELRQARSTLTQPSSVSQAPGNTSEDIAMEVETGVELNNISQPVVLPPREEWPPIIRPAIQGKSKVLTDDEERTIKCRSPPRRKSTNRDVESLIDGKLDDTKGRPVPREGIKGKEPVKTGKVEGQRLKASTSTTQPSISKQTVEDKRPAKDGLQPKENKALGKSAPRDAEAETWSQVAKRGTNKKTKQLPKPTASAAPTKQGKQKTQKGGRLAANTATAGTSIAQPKGPRKRRTKRRRVPRTSAVVLSAPGEEYNKLMAEVRSKIKLADLGIQEKVTMRTTATGALLIQIPGSENECKADALASEMKQVLAHKENVKVSRPVITADIRVWPLEPSISTEEVIEAIVDKGACQPREIHPGNKRVNQWHECLERGHTKETCPNPIDRSGKCYRCAEPGHTARECTSAPRCPICMDIGRKADHVLGSKSCTTQKRKGNPVSRKDKSAPTGQAAMEIDVQPPSDALPQRIRSQEEGARPSVS
ncbi:uncharacterized protein [Cardiocondyla obscurior]|uniref:uncharacterized protein n=1 Tax=Cardiocondyla obscurior TaxID=286306 RepID=UPI0039657DAC